MLAVHRIFKNLGRIRTGILWTILDTNSADPRKMQSKPLLPYASENAGKGCFLTQKPLHQPVLRCCSDDEQKRQNCLLKLYRNFFKM